MTSDADLRDLYQEVILDHSKRPRNYRKLEGANRKAEGYNPLCGDHFTVYVNLDGDRIREIGFEGSGCAISKASASMMTTSVAGKTTAEADALFEQVHRMLTGALNPAEHADTLGKLTVFSGVCEFPVRVKCASLPWHTLHAALADRAEPVTTE